MMKDFMSIKSSQADCGYLLGLILIFIGAVIKFVV